MAQMTRTSTLALRLGADALNLAVLEEAQQQRLHLQAHLAHFVEKHRAAVAPARDIPACRDGHR